MAETQPLMENKDPHVSKYVALNVSRDDIVNHFEVISENLGGERLTTRDLDRVTIPAGGATQWEVETAEGTEYTPELKAIIIHIARPRTYYKDRLEEVGRTVPTCFSPDGETGYGDPGGDCFTCELAKFGSSDDGRSTACKEYRNLFVLFPDSVLPTVVQVPVTSISSLRDYLKKLSGFKGSGTSRTYRNVETTFRLEKITTGPMPYSRVVFTADEGDLQESEASAIKEYISLMENSPIEFQDNPHAMLTAHVEDDETVEGDFEVLPDEALEGDGVDDVTGDEDEE